MKVNNPNKAGYKAHLITAANAPVSVHVAGGGGGGRCAERPLRGVQVVAGRVESGCL